MSRYLILSLIALGLSFTTVKAAHPAAQARYTVDVSAELDYLQVEACFEPSGTLSLKASSPRAHRLLMHTVGGKNTRVARRGDHIELSSTADRACISYRVDLAAAAQRGSWRGGFVVARDAILINPGLFLWLPEGMADVTVEFRLPAGYEVSAPWEPLAPDGQGAEFRTGVRVERDDGKVALGRFERYALAVDAAVIDVALLKGVPEVNDALIRRWLNANIDAVKAVYGRFPVPRLQLLVVPLGSGDEPVPWGQVSRGGGDAVHLYIDQRMPEQAFMDDWVLSHELSHLFHPYLAGDARWVYEGLASYYQNVSRARSGMISPSDAWEELHAGFERGRRGTRPGRTLSHATENMQAEQAYMQVYWSGAALFMLADIELRRTTEQRLSLDSVLEGFVDCCLLADRVWTEQAFFEQLDQLSETDVFTRLAAVHRNSDRFPDMTSAYALLGLQPISRLSLGFDSRPKKRAMRAAIMGAP